MPIARGTNAPSALGPPARAKQQFFDNQSRYELYRARFTAPSTIFNEPLYDKRPTTAPGNPQ